MKYFEKVWILVEFVQKMRKHANHKSILTYIRNKIIECCFKYFHHKKPEAKIYPKFNVWHWIMTYIKCVLFTHETLYIEV